MNKLQFALNEIKNNLFCCPKSKQESLNEDIKMMQNLVDMATPMCVRYETESIGDSDAFGGTGSMSYGVVICPNCEDYLDNDNHYDYCPTCGQALKWREVYDN